MPQQDAVDYSPYKKLGVDTTPSPGPAKASRFVDPRTGKFDYWGWLDAGMANLGKGGVLFEDDTPYPTTPYEPGKPSAFIAAGAPENAQMSDESRFTAKQAGGNGSLLQPVAMKAGEKVTPDKDAAPSAPTQEVAPPVPSGQGQRQTEPLPDEYTGLQITDEGWKATPWGDTGNSSRPIVPHPSSPEDYHYPKVPDPKDPKVKELIVSIAKKYGVPPELMLIKAFHESGFDQSKVSDVGAVGILQVLPSTAKAYGVDPTTLEGNIEAATQYMRKLLDKANGNPVLAEAGYFGGDSLTTNGKPFGPKTMDHVKKLLPGMDDELLQKRYPDDFASNPYTFWRYMYPYRK